MAEQDFFEYPRSEARTCVQKNARYSFFVVMQEV